VLFAAAASSVTEAALSAAADTADEAAADAAFSLWAEPDPQPAIIRAAASMAAAGKILLLMLFFPSSCPRIVRISFCGTTAAVYLGFYSLSEIIAIKRMRTIRIAKIPLPFPGRGPFLLAEILRSVFIQLPPPSSSFPDGHIAAPVLPDVRRRSSGSLVSVMCKAQVCLSA
jgi:hypothetical protein